MIDSDAAIRELLTTSTALNTIISTRIYCPSLPDGYDIDNPAMSYSCRGGVSELYVPLIRPSYQFTCWAASLSVARSAYRALHDRLHGLENIALSTAHLVSCIEQVHGQDRVDPQTGWYYVLSFYEFVFRE